MAFFERRFLGDLAKLGDAKPKILVFDDTRTWKMLRNLAGDQAFLSWI